MRIIKEYSAIANIVSLGADNSIEIELLSENKEKVTQYIDECIKDTDISYKTLNPLKIAAVEIFDTLAQNAGKDENTHLFCTCHEYYYVLVFEFSESALPLHTLNRSVKVLDPLQKKKSPKHVIGFMNAVNFVNRIDLSVDKISEKMRITIIKEKKYRTPKTVPVLRPLTAPFKTCTSGSKIEKEFSVRLFNKHGNNCDKFLITPRLFADNIAAGELETIFLEDKFGNCAGGAVWQKSFGIMVLMVFSVFVPKESEDYKTAVRSILTDFEKALNESGVGFLVSKKEHCEEISDFFDISDDKYCYKPTLAERKQTSYIKPDLIPLVKEAYKNFNINCDVKEIKYSYIFEEPYSVLTTKIDTDSSEAVLSILWFGDDLKPNIIRHIVALKNLGIQNIYFRLDLGTPEEASVSDLIQSCGFEAQYLWPYSSDKGDIVVFVYYGSTIYELKPCTISPITKNNAEKTAQLVKKVYGENYPSKYLYNPMKLWEKIRRRLVYPYIAIDDIGTAIGMISFIKLDVNPYLFEVGQLMIDPEHRGTNIVNQLIEYIHNTAINSLDFDAVFSESVTNHKLSQRSCINGGFKDTALKLNIMSEKAFSLEKEIRQIGRMSCVVSCIERADENFTVFLPSIYSENIKFCFDGLKARDFKEAEETFPTEESRTVFEINDDEAKSSFLLNITFHEIGSDFKNVIREIEQNSKENIIKCVLINIPLNNPLNSYAVKELKESGFFFGGVMPYWYPLSDALLMQKLYDSEPDWNNIKLFSRKIKKIATLIREDML